MNSQHLMSHSSRQLFGTTPDGATVERITLKRGGTTAKVITWGASLQDLRLDGIGHSLVLGAPDLDPYLDEMAYFGAIVGPIANRIKAGRAPLGNEILALERNENNRTALHSGSQGSSHKNWQILSYSAHSCTLILSIPDGAGGLPGPITLKAQYRLEQDGALRVILEGSSPAFTFCNLASHTYWTLDGSASLGQHKLMVMADHYLPLDVENIPLGPKEAVTGSRFDYRQPTPILHEDGGLDHNFCLSTDTQNDRETDGALPRIAQLTAGELALDVFSNAPGLQVYDGAHIHSDRGQHAHAYRANAGIALEPQFWPDAPNQSDYPSILLKPGDTFRQANLFRLMRRQ